MRFNYMNNCSNKISRLHINHISASKEKYYSVSFKTFTNFQILDPTAKGETPCLYSSHSSLRAHSSWHAQYLLRVLDLIFNTSDRSTTVSNCRLFQTRLSPTAIFQGTEHEQLRERECVCIWHFSALGAK